jgi:hypothetical protein
MKQRVIVWVSMALLSLCAEAANYTVKQAGGGDFTTIQACANAMTNGDTCTVYAGTYNEHVTLSAGAVGAYKTLQANSGDAVYVYDFTLSSHNKIIGFHIQNPSSPASATCVVVSSGATDVFITGNNLYACGSVGMIYGSTPSYASHVYVQNNTLSYGCSTSSAPDICQGIVANGDYWLIEGNDISHVQLGIQRTGSFGIVRNNRQHDVLPSDCIVGSHGSNCHFDFWFAEPGTATQYNVVEGNTIINQLGPDGKGILAQGEVCAGQCHHLIIRYNVGAHFGSGAVTNNNGARSDVNPGFYQVKSYNNTWVDLNIYNALYGIANYYSYNSTNAAEINGIFYYPNQMLDYNPYADDASTDPTFVARNNLGWCLGADAGVTCNLHSHVYGRGNFTDDPGNIKADPKFVNYAANDFRLSSGSPAIGAGSYLTTVAAGDSGTGTTLLVNDAGFFQDGYGIPGVKPDQIRLGTTTVVQITSINYATNTLVLASSVNRSPGTPVYLFSDSSGRVVLSGNAPDLGALPSSLQQKPEPPTGLAVTVS